MLQKQRYLLAFVLLVRGQYRRLRSMVRIVGCERRNVLAVLLLFIWCFHVETVCATASIKGSVFTVKKTDGTLVYSDTADYYHVQGMADANKVHAKR